MPHQLTGGGAAYGPSDYWSFHTDHRLDRWHHSHRFEDAVLPYREHPGRCDAEHEVENLADGVDNLRAELEILRDEFHKLDERMDFTERLLEPPKTEE